jgi:hypothetical protein
LCFVDVKALNSRSDCWVSGVQSPNSADEKKNLAICRQL